MFSCYEKAVWYRAKSLGLSTTASTIVLDLKAFIQV